MTKQERNKAYYEKNRERIREQQRGYYNDHREQIIASKAQQDRTEYLREYWKRPEVKYRAKLRKCGVTA